VERKRDLGGQIGDERPPGPARAPEPLPGALTPREEAVLIAERLAALVESRRAPVPDAPPPPAVTSGGVVGGGLVGGVVGARHSGRLLGNLLVTRGFIVEAELNYALTRQAGSGDPIGRILVDLGLITDRDLVELLAEQLRMEVVDLTRTACDPAVVALLPLAEARRRVALPLRRVDGLIDVAVAEPTDDHAVTELMRMLRAPLRLFLATRADIDAAIDRLYD
jgi:hypothetical protein